MLGKNYMDESYDPFWERATWDKKFSIWPKRCALSNKKIWLEYAYKGTRMITGPGEPVYEYRWLTRDEFIFGRLKGTL